MCSIYNYGDFMVSDKQDLKIEPEWEEGGDSAGDWSSRSPVPFYAGWTKTRERRGEPPRGASKKELR